MADDRKQGVTNPRASAADERNVLESELDEDETAAKARDVPDDRGARVDGSPRSGGVKRPPGTERR